MTDIFLGIIAVELGFIIMAVVGIFTLDTYAIHHRNKAETRSGGGGALRIMTPEEMVAHGINPADFLNSNPTKPLVPNEEIEANKAKLYL